MYRYSAFNLTISTPIELPFLPPARGDADVVITLAPRHKQAGPPPAMAQAFHVTPRFATLDYAALGTLTVREGRELQVALLPDADERLLPAYLTGPALAVLLYQRGLLVLQASAVSINGAAVLLMAGDGGGKSTLAARLCQQGYGLLADDLATVDMRSGQPYIIPAAPLLRLDAKAASALDLAPAWPEHALGGGADKRIFALEDKFTREPVPARALYHLQEGPDNNISYIPLQAGLMAVTYHSYPSCLLQPGGIENLRQCSRLVGSVAVCAFTCRRTLGELAEQTTMLEGHLAAQLQPLR